MCLAACFCHSELPDQLTSLWLHISKDARERVWAGRAPNDSLNSGGKGNPKAVKPLVGTRRLTELFIGRETISKRLHFFFYISQAKLALVEQCKRLKRKKKNPTFHLQGSKVYVEDKQIFLCLWVEHLGEAHEVMSLRKVSGTSRSQGFRLKKDRFHS